jgi:hypothetical protein
MLRTNFHGTQYIDEIVATRDKDKGQLFVHQDRTWNVIGKTDMNGNVVERYTYDPYGGCLVDQETHYGDFNGDQKRTALDRSKKDKASLGCHWQFAASARADRE